MTSIASISTTTEDPLMTTLAGQRQELLTETLSNIKKFICVKSWYSACTLAAALPDETNRQKMGYLIITRFVEAPLIDDSCRLCQWKMSCINCQRWGRSFFTRLSDVIFDPSSTCSSKRTGQISAIACLQMIASIWPDTSSDWVYIPLQKSLQSRHIMDTLSLAVYLKDEIVLQFLKYCSSEITRLAKEKKWSSARRLNVVAISFAMAKGLPFTTPLYSILMAETK